MKFEFTKTFNFINALRGMRNPLNSWDKGDSGFEMISDILMEAYFKEDSSFDVIIPHVDFVIGPNDMDLAKRLIKGGTEHRKFLRQIMVSVDITAPLYWWKEFDTYKVGTTANSTSTMHKLSTTPITIDCFEIDDYTYDLPYKDYILDGIIVDSSYVGEDVGLFISFLEELRLKYLETKDTRYWKELIRWLPESWLQTRTITMNYENLRSMYHQRENHKLTEWHSFNKWVASLPYAKELIIDNY